MAKNQHTEIPLLQYAQAKLEASSAPIGGWLQVSLLLAGVYNILWGVWTLAFPQAYFALSGLSPINHPQIWQCLGMVIGLYGLGYLIASTDITRYWPLVFIGLLGKIFGPVGYLYNYLLGNMSINGAWLLIFNDFIWWIPFGLILFAVYQKRNETGHLTPEEEEAMTSIKKICNASNEKPQLLIFLRHLGCTFSREMLQILGKELPEITAEKANPNVIHMGSEPRFRELLNTFTKENVTSYYDPTLALYRIFSFQKADLIQAFGLSSWIRGYEAGIKNNCGVGTLTGDGFQLSGIVLIENGKIVKQYQYKNASEQVSFLSFLKGLAPER